MGDGGGFLPEMRERPGMGYVGFVMEGIENYL